MLANSHPCQARCKLQLFTCAALLSLGVTESERNTQASPYGRNVLCAYADVTAFNESDY